MKNADDVLHVRGESRYVDDLPEPAGTLHAAVVPSPVAHGRLKGIDADAARRAPGVRAVLTAADIPGQNQIGTIFPDEQLFAEGEVHCVGHLVAAVVADTPEQARHAARLVKALVDPLPPVLDPREAFARGMLIAPARTFALGDVDAAWGGCDLIVEGRADSGGQEHVYIETQGAMAVPTEDGGVRIHSSTQGPTAVQRATARVLGLPMHKVEVDAPRLGGAFGGKEDQATAWAAVAGLAAALLRRPVKCVLRRGEDMRMTGKRHPYSSDFKLGLKKDGTFVAYEARFYQNAGCSADLSTAVLERTLFHCTNSYFIPNVRATAASCRTNLPSNTAFRGFGGPQGMFVIESAIARAAARLGVEPRALQERNLLREESVFPYGMNAVHCAARDCWAEAVRRYDLAGWQAEVDRFNASHRGRKKGLALMPICFGISFTNTGLNQASALVHVYTDGSVGVSTAAVEMGQGVNEKLRVTAARALGIRQERVRIESANTTRIANTSPTAASSGADLNGHATRLACGQILERLRAFAAGRLGAQVADVAVEDEQVRLRGAATDLTWPALVGAAYWARVSLSAQAHYATPHLAFDKAAEKGRPFLYHAYGTAIAEVTVDGLRGTFEVDAVKMVHDFGASLQPLVDRGQAEGALAQGIGWLTMEDVVYGGDGRLQSDTMTTYKVPDIHSAPRRVEVHFLGRENPLGLYGSKAIGEPPLMYGIGVYHAVRRALEQLRPGLELPDVAPLTHERVLMALHGGAPVPA
jgi:xanthine dehydrogenase large subunit